MVISFVVMLVCVAEWEHRDNSNVWKFTKYKIVNMMFLYIVLDIDQRSQLPKSTFYTLRTSYIFLLFIVYFYFK